MTTSSPGLRRLANLAYIASVAALVPIVVGTAACEKKPKVVVVEDKSDVVEERGKSESQLREEFEARKKARANAPEPKLDPNDPREKLELVWTRGKKRLHTIYNERADLTNMLDKRMKVLDKDSAKRLKPLFKPLSEFGMGKGKDDLEAAPKMFCDELQRFRLVAEAEITAGEEKLKVLNLQITELEKKQDAGGTVYQKQWDRLDEAKTALSAPVLAGRQILLFLRNILEEAEVLVEWGARRSQLALGKCLSETVAKTPLQLELAQETLERVIQRAKWYRK